MTTQLIALTLVATSGAGKTGQTQGEASPWALYKSFAVVTGPRENLQPARNLKLDRLLRTPGTHEVGSGWILFVRKEERAILFSPNVPVIRQIRDSQLALGSLGKMASGPIQLMGESGKDLREFVRGSLNLTFPNVDTKGISEETPYLLVPSCHVTLASGDKQITVQMFSPGANFKAKEERDTAYSKMLEHALSPRISKEEARSANAQSDKTDEMLGAKHGFDIRLLKRDLQEMSDDRLYREIATSLEVVCNHLRGVANEKFKVLAPWISEHFRDLTQYQPGELSEDQRMAIQQQALGNMKALGFGSKADIDSFLSGASIQSVRFGADIQVMMSGPALLNIKLWPK